jgi:hypothetical protein
LHQQTGETQSLGPRDELWCVGATLNNEVAGRLIEKIQQKFAKLKNISTFVNEKR